MDLFAKKLFIIQVLMIYDKILIICLIIYPYFSCYYQNLHQGYPDANVARFLKARDGNVLLAFKMVKNIALKC